MDITDNILVTYIGGSQQLIRGQSRRDCTTKMMCGSSSGDRAIDYWQYLEHHEAMQIVFKDEIPTIYVEKDYGKAR